MLYRVLLCSSHSRSLGAVVALAFSTCSFAQSTWRVDSLMNTWPVRQAMDQARSQAHPGVIKAVDTRNLFAALKKNAPGVPVFADSNVVRYVDLYGEPRREQFRALLGLAAYYAPMIEGQLVRQGLPREMKYLPMALSAMNALAGSPDGEAGLWMLTYPVALRYGLTVTAEIDERRDPFLSTLAAASYLKDLQTKYHDLGLTIAAFSCGPANVARARQRSGGAFDMRSLYPHFTTGHQEVLPQLMAFMHLASNAKELGIAAIDVVPMEPMDTLHVAYDLRFDAITSILGLPIDRLRAINPTLCADRVPAFRSFQLPRGEAVRFVQFADSVQHLQQRMHDLAAAASVPEPETVERTPDGREAIYYRVRSGDYLGRIASRFGVKVSQIKTWNKLRNDNIDAGEQLVIYVSPTKRVRYEREAENTTEEDGPTNQTLTKPTSPEVRPIAPRTATTYSWYTVRSGDSLYTIAKRYPGVDAKNLMDYNGISAEIRPGQKLKIPSSQ